MAMTPEESFALATAEPAAETEALVAPPEVDAEPAAETPEAPGPKVNPIWEEAWGEDVPDEIKARQAQVFDKWDRNVKAVEARYAPYRQFEEQGIDPGYLAQAISIQQALLENPRGFYDQMAAQWGFEQAQAQAAAAQQQANDPYESDEDRRLAEIQARLDAFEGQWTAQQQAAAEAQQRQAQTQYVESQLTDLSSKVGDYDREAVVERAILNATTGRNPSIEVAYYELKAQEDAILARHQRTAPKVLGGGAPAAAKPPAAPRGPLTNDELLAKAMATAKEIADGFARQ